MIEDREQKEDTLASIRHLLPDIKSEDAWLGKITEAGRALRTP